MYGNDEVKYGLEFLRQKSLLIQPLAVRAFHLIISVACVGLFDCLRGEFSCQRWERKRWGQKAPSFDFLGGTSGKLKRTSFRNQLFVWAFQKLWSSFLKTCSHTRKSYLFVKQESVNENKAPHWWHVPSGGLNLRHFFCGCQATAMWCGGCMEEDTHWR